MAARHYTTVAAARSGSLPSGRLAAWLADWIWIPGWALTGLLFLLFPNALPSLSRRPLGWTFAATRARFAGVMMLNDRPLASYPFVDNPLVLVPAGPRLVKLPGTLILLALGLVVVASLVPRSRRSRSGARQQYRRATFVVAVGTSRCQSHSTKSEAGTQRPSFSKVEVQQAPSATVKGTWTAFPSRAAHPAVA